MSPTFCGASGSPPPSIPTVSIGDHDDHVPPRTSREKTAPGVACEWDVTL
ncbi:hypothetical protein SGM_3081 [Streptomyces griseoaurantiacus M045]|uniref:Uncharacterized protein n=1 Tax=Streptomyces griseoaurantiacus M045 TaxID=996637 RepID=F3NJE7_9ACTN|nr:hypothetical protein SGM_3081 [Streptomyces griseoaurantiacus M045]